jgi:hypothetical protein
MMQENKDIEVDSGAVGIKEDEQEQILKEEEIENEEARAQISANKLKRKRGTAFSAGRTPEDLV